MHNADTLVILSPGFAKNEADSSCLPAQQLFVKALKKNFPELIVIIISFQYPYTHERYEWFGNKIIPLDGRNIKGKIKRLSTWYKAWGILKELKRNNKIIGLFSFWCTECALIGKYFGKYHHIPHYTWILGQDAKKDNRYISIIKPGAENLVAMSGFLANEFHKNHGILPRHIIPNGIAAEIFPSEQPEKDIDVLGVGSLIPLKQYDIFIRIIKELSKNLPGIKTAICGKGPEEKKLRSLISELQLENNVELYGELSHPEVLNLMQRSKVLLHPSNYEGFSTVCIEALYAGAKVISFCDPLDTDMPEWIIASSKEEMEEKLLEILQDPGITYKSVILHTMDGTAKKVIKLFRG